MPRREKFTNKAKEILEKMSSTAKFKKDVRWLREWLFIPVGGFKLRKDVDDWRGYNGGTEKLNTAVLSMIERHKLAVYDPFLIEEYLVHGNKFKEFEFNMLGCQIDETATFLRKKFYESPIEKKWRDAKQPFVKMLISSDASLHEAQQFLKEQWPWIRELFEVDGMIDKKRIRPTDNKSRDALIRAIAKRPHKSLLAETGRTRGNVELLVKLIFQKKYNVMLTTENIHRVLYKRRKR